METTPNLPDRLVDPAAFPHRPGRVRVVQTHISVVALAPPWVYKVKKPVDLGFADFSTLEKRKQFCTREVELNRRLSHGVYEGVVPISETGGRLAVEDGSDVVEWAVKMRYLEGDGFLHRRLQRGAVDEGLLSRVVARLCTFYRAQKPDAEVAQWGGVDRLKVSTSENFEQIEPFAGELLSRPAFDTLRRYTRDFFHSGEDIFEMRRAGGRILDCHGDLRLEHIHVSNGDIQIVDCIEFNDRLRYIDVASDIAFLGMDLDVHGRPGLAAFAAREAAKALSDDSFLRVLDFYKCYRACVRGKVQAMKSGEQEVDEDSRRKSAARARDFFRLALDYAVSGSGPVVLAVMGPVGSGKSTLAEALADALGWPVESSDVIRKEIAGVPPTQRGGEELYSGEMTEATYAELRRRARERARAGGSMILDAAHGRTGLRDALRRELTGIGCRYCFVELKVSAAAAKHRIAPREDDNSVSDARADDVDRLAPRYQPPDALEDAHVIGIDTVGRSPEAIVSLVLEHLSGRLALP